MNRALGGAVAMALIALACSTALVPSPAPTPASHGVEAADEGTMTARAPSATARTERAGTLDVDRVVRVALAAKIAAAPVSATAGWSVGEQGGALTLVRGQGGEPWRIEQNGGLLRLAGDGGDATPWREGPFVARSSGASGFVQYQGRRYRGELWFVATDSGILVVNRLAVEDYLRGVVPLELGTRQPADRGALEAQSIAARSYTYMRVPASHGASEVVPAAGWHVVATVINQVYGGADVEHAVVDAAVDATAGLVLRYGGLIVDAPYSSSCGGRTAAPREAWRGVGEEPYLQSVDDTDPATGKPYCDISPRNHWVEELDEARLRAVVHRALVASGSSSSSEGTATELLVRARTVSGRIATLTIRTDRGETSVRASDLRTVFQNARSAILFSTNFQVDRVTRARGGLTGVTLRGAGNGHGVGMCQWGAIGRSRAGQDARSILRHYYPGTVVGYAD